MKYLSAKSILPLALAILGIPALSQAATVDLTTFTATTTTNGSFAVAPNLATLYGTTSISGSVSAATSFEWNFIPGDGYPFNDYLYVTTSAGTAVLASVFTDPDPTTLPSAGWQVFTFLTPYTGAITLGGADGAYMGIDSFDSPSTSAFRNLAYTVRTVPAVPEPETYALMLAGVGLLALTARRKGRPANRHRSLFAPG